MCGRIGQFSPWQVFADPFSDHFGAAAPMPADARPRFNVGPGTRAVVMHAGGDVRRTWWGYRPHWAVDRKVPQMINARADKIVSATWKPLLRAGRVIVPADCWYEWVKDEAGKQPYLLHARDGAALFLAGLTNVAPDGMSGPRDAEHGAGMVDGVVIVTDASDAGMVDIHDRRPVALSAADAQHWLDPDTSVEHAAEIARTASRPIADFEWFKVSRAVNDARHDDPDLIRPIA
ncbi:MAG: SOS response-associated peptidase [Janthinobacterium lividum]